MKKLTIVAALVVSAVAVWALWPKPRLAVAMAKKPTPVTVVKLSADEPILPMPAGVARRVKAPSPRVDSKPMPASGRAESKRSSTAKTAIEGRDEILKEKNGVYGYNSTRYDATFDRGWMAVGMPMELAGIGQPRLLFRLSEIKAGDALIASGGEVAPRAKPEERMIVYSRGNVEEQYLLDREGVEQRFLIRNAVTGAITVTGRVDSNLQALDAKGNVLRWGVNGVELMSISKAVAIDAEGRRQEVALALSAGLVTMTIPAEFVASAAFPIVLDPLIGGIIEVSGDIPDIVESVRSGAVRTCDVAYNTSANEWLIVWDERFGADPEDFDVFTQRVSVDGALVGATSTVSATTQGDYEPSLCFAPGTNRYLVAWRHDPDVLTGNADQRIHGRVLSSDSSAFTGVFEVENPQGQDFAPSIAFDGSRWYVVASHVQQGDFDVIGRFVTTAGVPETVADLDADLDHAERPSVAFINGVYCVVWEKGPEASDHAIVARLVQPNGTMGSAITTVSTSTANHRQPDVSAGDNLFLIVWQRRDVDGPKDIYGRIANSSLAFQIGESAINNTPGAEKTPRAEFSTLNHQWFVVYSEPQGGNKEIFGNRVATDGTVFTKEQVTSNIDADRRPELAWNPVKNELLVAHLFGAVTPFRIRAVRWSMDYTAPTVGQPVGAPNPNNTGSHTVTWTSNDVGGSGITSYEVQRALNAGSFVTVGTPTSVSHPESNLPEGSYVYRVRATDGAGNVGAYSADSLAVIVDKTAPTDPAALAQYRLDGTTAIPVGDSTPETSVVLAGQVTDAIAAKLEVEAKTVGVAFDGTGTVSSAFIASGTAAVTVGPLAVDVYHWRARAVDAAGNAGNWVSFGGNNESAADFVIGTPTPPPAPVITTLGHKTRDATPPISGTSSAGVTISVYVNNVLDGTTVSSGVWSYTLTTKPEGNYSIKAQASNMAGASPDSNSIVLVIDLTKPEPPTNVRTTSYATCIVVEWDASTSTDVAGYRVYRSDDNGLTWSPLNATGLVTNTRFKDESAQLGVTHRYRVTAADNTVGD